MVKTKTTNLIRYDHVHLTTTDNPLLWLCILASAMGPTVPTSFTLWSVLKKPLKNPCSKEPHRCSEGCQCVGVVT